VRLAETHVEAKRPALVITHGFAGCGKSTLSQGLLECIGAIRIRTDVERKRLHGLGAHQSSRSGIAGDLYAPDVTRATYERVAALARTVVASGLVAIIDAAFLRRWQRDLFRALADELGVTFVIVDIAASEATLRERVRQRASVGNDASEAGLDVLAYQVRTDEPIAPDERADVVTFDGELPPARGQAADAWRGVTDAIGTGRSIPTGPGRHENGNGDELAARIAFLSRPENYPESTTRVERIETHQSWVFLTERHAYKLKKPVQTEYVDLRDVSSRRRNCNDEVRLNRRLSEDVYLAAVPLAKDAAGDLTFGQDDAVVEWLVKMRRLPADRMLDWLILKGATRRADVAALVRRLCAFYGQCPPTRIAPAAYRQHFTDGIAAYRRELCRAAYGLSVERVDRISALQLAYLSHAETFDARVSEGRIVEGHGDLRPEHICLEAEPQIIDCLEFSRSLRTLDTIDELGFLALECERLGAPSIGAQILDAYRAQTGDAAPAALVDFYQSYRACVRAVLAILHLRGPTPHVPDKWRGRANEYLELARAHVERCA
jgi:aminoglycoside phosphotransferase family enzyme/predicted kinase